MNFLDTTRPCIKHNPHHALTRGLEVIERHVKYTPPTVDHFDAVGDDLMARIGAQVDLVRHNKALEAHKKKHNQTLEWIALDDVDDVYDEYMEDYNALWGTNEPSDDQPTEDYIGCAKEDWVTRTMEVRYSDELLTDDWICSPQFLFYYPDDDDDDDIVQIY